MNLFSIVEGVIIKLSVIPGLRFLHGYVTEIQGRRVQAEQSIQGYVGYVRALRDAGADVKKSVRGPKKDREEEIDEEEIDDEFVDDEEEDDDESYLQ